MKKIAFLYPGQGSQKVGMGKDFKELYPPAEEIFDKAQKIVEFDVEKICTQGPEGELIKTSNLQPALVTISWILTKFIKEKGILPSAAAGHSLGEYSALLAAEVLDFPAVLKIVKERAHLMEEVGKKEKGTMAAIIGLSTEKILEVCNKMEGVYAVNFNCPGQVVISGYREKLKEAEEKLKKEGAKKVIFLPVSGAFHSPLMKEAAERFSSFLDKFDFKDPICPVVTNTTGEYATSGKKIKDNLKLQMDHPVLWEKSMKTLLQDGYHLFLEIGPGNVLQGLMRRIKKKANIKGVESIKQALDLVTTLNP